MCRFNTGPYYIKRSKMICRQNTFFAAAIGSINPRYCSQKNFCALHDFHDEKCFASVPEAGSKNLDFLNPSRGQKAGIWISWLRPVGRKQEVEVPDSVPRAGSGKLEFLTRSYRSAARGWSRSLHPAGRKQGHSVPESVLRVGSKNWEFLTLSRGSEVGT